MSNELDQTRQGGSVDADRFSSNPSSLSQVRQSTMVLPSALARPAETLVSESTQLGIRPSAALSQSACAVWRPFLTRPYPTLSSSQIRSLLDDSQPLACPAPNRESELVLVSVCVLEIRPTIASYLSVYASPSHPSPSSLHPHHLSRFALSSNLFCCSLAATWLCSASARDSARTSAIVAPNTPTITDSTSRRLLLCDYFTSRPSSFIPKPPFRASHLVLPALSHQDFFKNLVSSIVLGCVSITCHWAPFQPSSVR